MRVATAFTSGAPAPTIVIDGRHLDPSLERADLLAAVDPDRHACMLTRPDCGPKTVVLRSVDERAVAIEFFQGLNDGAVDLTVAVCGNSAAAGMAVARHVWDLIPAGPVTLTMGGGVFGYEEVHG